MSDPVKNPEVVENNEEVAEPVVEVAETTAEVVEVAEVAEEVAETVVEVAEVAEPAEEVAEVAETVVEVAEPVVEVAEEAGKEEEEVVEEAESVPTVLHITDQDHVIDLAEHEDLEGDLKEIYDLVKAKISQIVSTGKFTAEHLRPLILNVVEIVQEYTKNKYDHIDGAQKKAMAMNIMRHVIVDLHKNGQINQEQYELILLGLEFFGGALVDLAKIAWRKLIEVIDDVADNGCAGCFGRNCRRRRNRRNN